MEEIYADCPSFFHKPDNFAQLGGLFGKRQLAPVDSDILDLKIKLAQHALDLASKRHIECLKVTTTTRPSTTDIDECASQPCKNWATCKDGVNSYSCVCLSGYTGQTCATDIDECASQPCKNGATCYDGVNSYMCVCQPGYTGQTCTVDIDECASHPCKNGATCGDGVNSYSCVCPPGYTGQTCNIDIDECASQPCKNGATCKDGVNSYSCVCLSGYTGQTCAIEIDECASQPCKNGATCMDGVNFYSCVCLSGYTGQTCAKNCKLRVDVAFLVDESGTVGEAQFQKVLQFIHNMVNTSFNVSKDAVRVAMITFGTGYKVQFILRDTTNKTDVLNKIDAVAYQGGGTDTSLAIRLARVAFLNPLRPAGARKGIPQIAIVITDGLSDDPTETKKEAELAQKQGIEIFAIGIGNFTNYSELQAIASDPDDGHVYNVDDFTALMNIGDMVSRSICKGLHSASMLNEK
ncbi:sushi, von Willebrand factor type A, EGF and pentraxin domain-containing protein 1-like [Lingula anatina]|uniref:Sushi, von Willebrand factor type A, EGF and pentraxin domain-containing protein 1-like n=1 Tax=Lingula anatina TaxID=7574 RepID=A0A1S3HVW1_LINAN|nr:sushi, von Willebrand factor type A, EGF and pentraxin domain-containing protein 1-like [Lingula anatina]|eukprot:XP_013390182.2 sushi, von Willebrand factor type A, EGF and pentraxin domain-containing protein 1-like [Lingula anatina]